MTRLFRKLEVVDDDDVKASYELHKFMNGKQVSNVYVTDILTCHTSCSSTGMLVIEFTDGSTFALSEGGQAGYFDYDMFPKEVT